jgi:putative IMPACT (imprinted ancient) family translation regulator
LVGTCSGEVLEVKKSKFTGYASSATSAKQSIAAVEAHRTGVDRRVGHVCWGWRGADGGEGSSDDGEPSGTAGTLCCTPFSFFFAPPPHTLVFGFSVSFSSTHTCPLTPAPLTPPPGRPIVAAIAAADLVDTVVIVERVYGGTNLGTGGLARAYGGAARLCLDQVCTHTLG